MKHKLRVKTVILSDVHLGTEHCKIAEVNHFLRMTSCERLILNGDIIDGWRLRRAGGWTREHTRFLRLALRKVEKHDTELIYLRGNHDDLLGRFLPIAFDRIRIQEDYILETGLGKYLILHGDVLDAVTTCYPFVSKVGAVGYDWLLALNRLHDRWRRWRGKECFSLSKEIKARVKASVNYVSRFEHQIRLLAKDRGCRGVICGHIHTPADVRAGGFHYLTLLSILPLSLRGGDTGWEALLNARDFTNALTCLKSEFSKAFAACDDLLKTFPDFMPAYYQLGRTAALSGAQLERGADGLKKYLEYKPVLDEPPIVWTHYRLGMIYAKQKKPDSAQREYQRALQRSPKHQPTLDELKKVRPR